MINIEQFKIGVFDPRIYENEETIAYFSPGDEHHSGKKGESFGVNITQTTEGTTSIVLTGTEIFPSINVPYVEVDLNERQEGWALLPNMNAVFIRPKDWTFPITQVQEIAA